MIEIVARPTEHLSVGLAEFSRTEHHIAERMHDGTVAEHAVLEAHLDFVQRVAIVPVGCGHGDRTAALVHGGHAGGGINLGSSSHAADTFFGNCFLGGLGNIQQAHSLGFGADAGEVPCTVGLFDRTDTGIFHTVAHIDTVGVDVSGVEVGELERHRVAGAQVVGGVLDDDRVHGAGAVEVFLGGMGTFGHQGIVIAPPGNQHAFRGLVGAFFEGDDIVFNAVHLADRGAVQVGLKQIDLALFGEVAVPVDEAGQHGFSLEVDYVAHIGGVESFGPGFGFAAHKDDFPVQRSDDLSGVGLV